MDVTLPPVEIVPVEEYAMFQARATKRRKKDDLTEEEKILKDARQKQLLVVKERNRVAFFRSRHDAAVCIQKAWRMFKFRTKGLMKNARDAIKQKRLDAGELEWKKQIAACTIQLAWRKYYRRKLLGALTSTLSGAAATSADGSSAQRQRVLHMWDPQMISAKQRSLVEQVYGEQLYVPEWHPQLQASLRPYWMRVMPSPAALSFNFAIDQYHPQLYPAIYEQVLPLAKPLINEVEELDKEIQDDLIRLRLAESPSVSHYSYNLSR